MKVYGKVTVGSETLEKELDLSGLTELEIERAVVNYTMGLQATILHHLQVGDYKDGSH